MKTLKRLWGWLRCKFDVHDGSVTFVQAKFYLYYIHYKYTSCSRCGKVLSSVKAPMF